MDKVTPIATPIGSLLALLYIDCKKSFRYTKHKIGHSKNLEDNYKKLKEAAEDLSSRRSDIENAAKSDKTKQLLEECNSWIKRAKESEKEAQSLALVYEEKYKNQNGKFWDPLLHPNRIKLSKQMAKKCKELREHLSKGILTLVKKLPERVMRTTNAPKIEKKSSLCLAVEEILGHLRAPDVRKVGLWGIVGVGKTAIMQNVNNNANIAEMFDIVIWLPVPKDWNIEKLQCAIMQRLELNVEDITKPDEAIRKELEGQKYLLLLDEVCEVLDLPKIGIESIENGSKVVLATRSYSICHDMETDREVEVQRLSKKDAFDMFKEKLGENVNLSGIKPIAEKVVNECSYLPFLIEKIASACRRYKEDYNLWSAGLRTLQSLNTKVQGMDEVIGFLEFCYNQLGDEEKKFCFL